MYPYYEGTRGPSRTDTVVGGALIPNPGAPSIQITPALGPKVHKFDTLGFLEHQGKYLDPLGLCHVQRRSQLECHPNQEEKKKQLALFRLPLAKTNVLISPTSRLYTTPPKVPL